MITKVTEKYNADGNLVEKVTEYTQDYQPMHYYFPWYSGGTYSVTCNATCNATTQSK